MPEDIYCLPIIENEVKLEVQPWNPNAIDLYKLSSRLWGVFVVRTLLFTDTAIYVVSLSTPLYKHVPLVCAIPGCQYIQVANNHWEWLQMMSSYKSRDRMYTHVYNCVYYIYIYIYTCIHDYICIYMSGYDRFQEAHLLPKANKITHAVSWHEITTALESVCFLMLQAAGSRSGTTRTLVGYHLYQPSFIYLQVISCICNQNMFY